MPKHNGCGENIKVSGDYSVYRHEKSFIFARILFIGRVYSNANFENHRLKIEIFFGMMEYIFISRYVRGTPVQIKEQ